MRAPSVNGPSRNTTTGRVSIFAWLIMAPMVFLLTIYEGWVLSRLWAWFIQSRFHLGGLSLKEAMGITIIVSLMTSTHVPRDEEEVIEYLKWTVYTPILLLILGWVVLQVF